MKIDKKIDIKPMPSPRPRVTKNGTYMPKEYQQHKNYIQWVMPKKKFKGGVKIRLVFGFKLPKAGVKRRKYPFPKGDIDQYIKTVMDALEGVTYENDTQVIEVTAKKIYSDDDFTHITVKDIDTQTNICYNVTIRG